MKTRTPKLRPLAHIPNTAGFRFILLHRITNCQWPAVVVKAEDGTHHAARQEDGHRLTLSNFAGWQPSK